MRPLPKAKIPAPEVLRALPPENIVAFSGGKDSTALALRLHEMGESFVLLFTETGNELPEVRSHIDNVVKITGARFVTPPNQSLGDLIDHFSALPNWRMRWCTRMIKIQPCIAYLAQRPGSTLHVGLRADEETREGLYGPYATYSYPLRDWGWGLQEVTDYVAAYPGVQVPARTDCAVCPYQRLGEWYELWRHYPDHWAQGKAWEAQTGHTFRSPSRDTWPAGLAGLQARFEAGDIPRGVDEDGRSTRACRVCSL